jgi:hypothetical protein
MEAHMAASVVLQARAYQLLPQEWVLLESLVLPAISLDQVDSWLELLWKSVI